MLPNIKIDADSRNIEELDVHPDETRYNPRKTEEEMKRFEERGYAFKDYDGMMLEMPKETLVIDDISHYETEEMIKMFKPQSSARGLREIRRAEKWAFPASNCIVTTMVDRLRDLKAQSTFIKKSTGW